MFTNYHSWLQIRQYNVEWSICIRKKQSILPILNVSIHWREQDRLFYVTTLARLRCFVWFVVNCGNWWKLTLFANAVIFSYVGRFIWVIFGKFYDSTLLFVIFKDLVLLEVFQILFLMNNITYHCRFDCLFFQDYAISLKATTICLLQFVSCTVSKFFNIVYLLCKHVCF